MAEEPLAPETGIERQQHANRTGIQVNATVPPPAKDPPAPVAQDRELVWVVLGGALGGMTGFCAYHFQIWDAPGLAADLTGTLLLWTIVGAVLGFVGGCAGEFYRAGRFEHNLVIYWSVYWALFRMAVSVALNIWAMAVVRRGGGDLSAVWSKRFLLLAAGNLVLSALVGAFFGAIGGAIKACLAKDSTRP
jgi:hypothetical protein